ncbi:MAG: Rieske (2Fe-2S) protein [Chloroflexi bacterium]|nr:MAG: Rieske (2Fe-2S) protein [Chloroflexota bacterium]
MSEFIKVSQVGELKDGAMKEILVRGREILLARVEGKYYATDNRCPHMGGKLSQGELEGTIVTCPRHSSQFDLSNGQVVRWLKGSGLLSMMSKIVKPPRPINTYQTKVEGDEILVEI